LKNIWNFGNVLTATCGHLSIRNGEEAIEVIFDAIGKDKSLLVCRDGGSTFEAMHNTGELVERSLKRVSRSQLYCIT
jgi:phosphoheptose isomerase